jgi:pimeloyl-ACP methyl ester carboxylesterase
MDTDKSAELFPDEIPALPDGIRSRFVDNGNGLLVHLLEAGGEQPDQPVILLLHGFPELAYSWRKVMMPLAAAGYRVLAPDQRGYGRTTGSIDEYETDLTPFFLTNYVADHVGTLAALGISRVDMVVGHDYGSPVAAYCALIRPDVFQRVALMSAPFGGPPAFAGDTDSSGTVDHDGLLALQPPREHYQWYYSGVDANTNMLNCAQGVHQFLRAYYHYKSADWAGNQPYRLRSSAAADMAVMPTYYIMNHLDGGMAQTVAPYLPDDETVSACQWLTEQELAFYAAEYSRTGFQGGLQSYRCKTGGQQATVLRVFANRTIDVPATFISGGSDWGTYQKPGELEKMQDQACSRFDALHLVTGAGHWVQQEQPGQVCRLLLEFMNRTA